MIKLTLAVVIMKIISNIVIVIVVRLFMSHYRNQNIGEQWMCLSLLPQLCCHLQLHSKYSVGIVCFCGFFFFGKKCVCTDKIETQLKLYWICLGVYTTITNRRIAFASLSQSKWNFLDFMFRKLLSTYRLSCDTAAVCIHVILTFRLKM